MPAVSYIAFPQKWKVDVVAKYGGKEKHISFTVTGKEAERFGGNIRDLIFHKVDQRLKKAGRIPSDYVKL